MVSRSRPAGFTLIEVIVSLAIFSSLIAVLMLGYRQGLLLWEQGQSRSQHFSQLEFRYSLLNRMFAQAVAASYTEYNGEYVPYFVGDENRIAMMTTAPLLGNPGSVRPATLNITEQLDGTYSVLYREGRPGQDPMRGLGEQEDDEAIVLLEGLVAAFFVYEARALPLSRELSMRDVSEDERVRFRDNSEWVDRFDSHIMWHLPRRARLVFFDENETEFRWTFPMPMESDAWSLRLYQDGL